MLKSRGYSVELIPWNSSHWSEMACGGRNACCQNVQASLQVIRHLLSLPAATVPPAASASAPLPPTSSPSTSLTSTSSSAPAPTTRALTPSRTGDSVRTLQLVIPLEHRIQSIELMHHHSSMIPMTLPMMLHSLLMSCQTKRPPWVVDIAERFLKESRP